MLYKSIIYPSVSANNPLLQITLISYQTLFLVLMLSLEFLSDSISLHFPDNTIKL